MKQQDEASAALQMIKAVYDDGKAEINGREYEFTTMKHKKRRKVFAYFSRIQPQIEKSDFSFMDTPEFEPVEAVINDAVTVDGSLLSRLDDHWDKHPGDYVMFIITAMGAISYPFLDVGHTG